MKKLESTLLNMVLVLTSVTVLMGFILAYMNHLTTDPIALQKEFTTTRRERLSRVPH